MTWVIILIVLFVLIVFFLIGFSVIFFSKRTFRNQDYALKKTFNYLKSNSITLKSIENLVNNNEELEPILIFLEEKNENYKKQLDVLKEQLVNNSKLLKGYSLVAIYNSIKVAKTNVKLLLDEHSEFKKFTLNTEEYSNYVSKLSIDLFSIISDIKNFFIQSRLDLTFDNLSKRKKMLKEIDKTTEQINIKLNYINSTDINRFLVSQIINVRDLFNLYNNLFDVEKYVMSCRSLIDRINSENIIILNNHSEIKKSLTKYEKYLDDIAESIENYEFTIVKKKLRTILEELEIIYRNIILEKECKKIFEKYFYIFKECANGFYVILNENSIKQIYESILENFKKDQEICELTQNNINLTQNICYKITNLDDTLKNNILDYESNIRSIQDICDQIIKFKNDNEKLYKITNKKYDDFLKMSLKLSDLDIKLFHIVKLIKNQKIKNNEIVNKSNKYRETIETISNEFVKKYYNSEKVVIENNIKSIEEFISVSLDAIRRELVLKELYNLIRLYANRYYSKDREAELSSIDNLSKSNNYDEAINSCINFVNKCKKIRKVS